MPLLNTTYFDASNRKGRAEQIGDSSAFRVVPQRENQRRKIGDRLLLAVCKQLEALVAFVGQELLPPGFSVKSNERVFNDEGIQIAE